MGLQNEEKLGEYEDDIDFAPLDGQVLDDKLPISDVYVSLADNDTNQTIEDAFQ